MELLLEYERIPALKTVIVPGIIPYPVPIATAKKRVEIILDFQLICHLHSGTKCLHTWYKPLTICTRM